MMKWCMNRWMISSALFVVLYSHAALAKGSFFIGGDLGVAFKQEIKIEQLSQFTSNAKYVGYYSYDDFALFWLIKSVKEQIYNDDLNFVPIKLLMDFI